MTTFGFQGILGIKKKHYDTYLQQASILDYKIK
jgi:hypothetical protein